MRTIFLTTALCALLAVPAYAEDDDETEMPSVQSLYAAIERTVPQQGPTFSRPLRPADIQPVDQNRAPPAMTPPPSAPAWRPSAYDSLLK
jgi:hypothetical protein